jgi:anti-anti-sigma factor
VIPFEVSVASNGDSVTIALGGELDLATVDRAREALEQVPPGTPVVLDLSRLTFIDSTGLGLIAAAAKHTNGQLSVIPDDRTRRLLDLTGMTGHLTLLDPA